jgi:allantoicase
MIGRMTGHAAGPPGDYRECGPAACDLLIRGRRVVTPAGLRAAAVGIAGGQVSAIEPAAGPAAAELARQSARVVDLAADEVLLPGLVDAHVHVNEPGRTEWEGFASATRAAAAGGITTVIDMPLNSVPPTVDAAALRWEPLVARAGARGDAVNEYAVSDWRCWTHVRLSIYPDGGVARFRVHGEVLPDPAFLTGTADLAAMRNGGRVTDCSDAFYSPPAHLIMPGRARVMSDGWENARRGGPGNDYVVIRLAAPGRLRHVEIDTSCFVGNAPGWARLSAADERAAARLAQVPPGGMPAGPPGDHPDSGLDWQEVLAQTRLQPDTRHRFLVGYRSPCTHIRLDVLPDGGLARLRAYGEVEPEALAGLRRQWQQAG